MFKDIQAVFFDLDGTLIDSVPDLAIAVDTMLIQLGLPPRGEAKVRTWVGNGAENLIRRALADDMAGHAPPELVHRAHPLFEAAYAENIVEHTTIYPGVLQGLQRLQDAGLLMACITNKPSRFAAPLIEQLGLMSFFKTVIGGECVPNKKPAPDALLLAAERISVTINRVLMVGDSMNDVGAARNAGCAAVVAVPYGYNHGRDIREALPDVVIASLAELPTLLGLPSC